MMTSHNAVFMLLLVLQGVLVSIAEQDPSLGFNQDPFSPSRHKVWNNNNVQGLKLKIVAEKELLFFILSLPLSLHLD